MTTHSGQIKQPLSLVAAVVSLALGAAAHAQTADSYVPSTGLLTIPSLVIGSADFQNVVVSVAAKDILQQPSGTYATAIGDYFDTTNDQLFIASVTVGPTTYYNPVVMAGALQSIGYVAGASAYAGGLLTMPAVQVLGGPLYTNVSAQIGPSQIKGVGGGLPIVGQNTFNPATGTLTVPVAEYNGHYYTNVTASVALSNVTHVGGHQGLDSVVYPFTGTADGANPSSTLLQGTDGSLYGTTPYGGGAGYGTVFKVSPQGTFTLLHTFAGTDGSYPYAGLVQDGAGNLYGTTSSGGALNFGTVFEIAANGTESTLYSFTGQGTDGQFPNGLMLASDGNLYGTTSNGGGAGGGTVFKVTVTGGASPTVATLHAFAGMPTDGGTPFSGLVQGKDGFLYGMTYFGGSVGQGSIYRISTSGAESLQYSFTGNGGVSGSTDGALPEADLVQAPSGMLYGTTYAGGLSDVGTVFAFNPSSLAETQLHAFSGAGAVPGSGDGAYPFTGVIVGTDGNLYGTAPYGGAYNEGTVYQVTPGGVETTLYSFNGDDGLAGSTDGAYPNAVIQGSDGFLYGTTYNGGYLTGTSTVIANSGVVFRIAP